jgi:hypothetical protein
MASRPKTGLGTEDRKLIDEVFARRHIEKLIEGVERDQKRGKSFLARIADHPLAVIFVAAIPLITFSCTQFKDSGIRREANLSTERAEYQAQIDRFSSDILNRANRSILLYYALKGELGKCPETGQDIAECRKHIRELVYDRKKTYDASYIRWNVNFPNYFRQIERVKNTSVILFEDIEEELKKIDQNSFKAMDGCLTNLHASYIENGEPPQEPGSCNGFVTEARRIKACGIAIAQGLQRMNMHVFERLLDDDFLFPGDRSYPEKEAVELSGEITKCCAQSTSAECQASD